MNPLFNCESKTNQTELNDIFVYSSCSLICGNGKRESSEECDDGNTESQDGCSKDCGLEEGFTCSTPP